MRALVIFVVFLLGGCAAQESWQDTLAKSAQDQRNFYEVGGWQVPSQTPESRCRAESKTTPELDACLEAAANSD